MSSRRYENYEPDRQSMGSILQRLFDRYPIRGALALLLLSLLMLACLYVNPFQTLYSNAASSAPPVFGFEMLLPMLAGYALGFILLLVAIVSLFMGVVEVLHYLLNPPSNLCPNCGAARTDAWPAAVPLSPGFEWLQCPGCGKEWKKKRFRW